MQQKQEQTQFQKTKAIQLAAENDVKANIAGARSREKVKIMYPSKNFIMLRCCI